MSSRRERITFTGPGGHTLSGKVELPVGPVRGTAVFAHCFTCSSDSAATSRISVALADAGIAVMRFDFTGLGASEGDFSDTNFTSNVADLVAAATHLQEHHDAPSLLIGHSLGGAAVLAAARRLPSVRAVVTIGAPSRPDHVVRLLSAGLDQLRREGEATVDLGGRPFTVKAQLVDDLSEHSLEQCLAQLDAALLVMHSPTDQTVGVENAADIYALARHPKSFVSLDGADHLLTDRADAAFAASMVRAWVERYLEPSTEVPLAGSAVGVVVGESGHGTFLNQVVAGSHRFAMDEPTSVGGFDAGPTPYDLLAAALGGCTSMTMRLYADRKGIPLTRAEVEVRHGTTHLQDCEVVVGSHPEGTDHWERRVVLEGDLSDQHRRDLLRIADRCPVHRTLSRASVVVTELVE